MQALAAVDAGKGRDGGLLIQLQIILIPQFLTMLAQPQIKIGDGAVGKIIQEPAAFDLLGQRQIDVFVPA